MQDCKNKNCEDFDDDLIDNCSQYCDPQECEDYAPYVAQVTFPGNSKQYSYFSKFPVKAGDKVVVTPYGQEKTVTVKHVTNHPTNKAKAFIKQTATKGGNTMSKTLSKSKQEIIDNQIGEAIIKSVKTMILQTPQVPEAVKDLVKRDGYSDAVIGLLVSLILEHVFDNPKAQYVGETARKAGIINLSKELSWVSDLIDQFGHIEDEI